ncbi:MAG: tetratricopeptide repeat protein, partial [Planctomycetota bacterium]
MAWDGPDPETRLERAIASFHDGNVARAERDLRELEGVGYRCTEVLLYLGHCALARDRLSEALSHYREARQCGPDQAEVYVGLAVVAARRLHFRRAIRRLRHALELEPRLQEAHDNLILCHAALGEHTAAEAAYECSVALDPDSPHPHYNAGFVFFDRGDADRARRLWGRVLEIEPGYPDAERLVASCERVLGNLPAARRRLERLVRRQPRNLDALADLGAVHEERDEWQSAARM